MTEPVQYHDKDSCNSCGAMENEIKTVSTDCGYISECTTTCKVCGFADYWCYGFFESSAHMKSNCKKYSFGNKP